MKKLVSVREALESPAWLGGILGAPSFRTMRTLLIVAMGDALDAEELAIFTQVTARTEAPAEPCEEVWIVAGRRSGKSLGVVVLAAYLSACCDYRGALARGERGVLSVMAASAVQAQQIFNFAKGIFAGVPKFAYMVQNIAASRRAGAASFRTIRGVTWQSDEDSADPDHEILAAVRPSLATTGGTLFAIGSPHAWKGETLATFKKHFGPTGNPKILVANGPTKLFNPTIKTQ
jgi:hypothetical protein